MIEQEKIAHDLAVLWVQNVLNGKLKPMVEATSLVEEYLAAYQSALEKLKTLKDK